MPSSVQSTNCCLGVRPQERTYKRFYGLLAQRFCYINRIYMVSSVGVIMVVPQRWAEVPPCCLTNE